DGIRNRAGRSDRDRLRRRDALGVRRSRSDGRRLPDREGGSAACVNLAVIVSRLPCDRPPFCEEAAQDDNVTERLVCITCNSTYDVAQIRYTCDCGGLLEVQR